MIRLDRIRKYSCFNNFKRSEFGLNNITCRLNRPAARTYHLIALGSGPGPGPGLGKSEPGSKIGQGIYRLGYLNIEKKKIHEQLFYSKN